MNFNFAAFQGNLTRDVELVGKENNVARFSIAVNNGYGENEETMFMDCVAFGKQAEIIVRGSMAQSRWEDPDGNKRSKHELKLDSFNGFNFVSGGRQENGESEVVPAAATEDLF
jgi:single-strand DNA-binding protein